ncbi:MAG: DUF2892 domain-containing protein [Acidobacteriota bacterium]
MTFRNVGLLDRMFRVALGVLMLGLGWQESLWILSMPSRVFAFYPLITGMIAWCPVYALLRFNSRR